MRACLFTILLALLTAQAAYAEPYWSQIGLTTSVTNAPKVLAAADAFMSSKVGKKFPGRLLLQANVADGSDPATHTFVPIFKSAADREKFLSSLEGDASWIEFQTALERLGEARGTVLFRNLRSWGDVNDKDDVWMSHSLTVRDPAAVAAAMDAFMASPTGKKSPGQVYLSAVVAGGVTPVTHVISVGYESVEEMADWLTVRNASTDWATFQTSMRKSSDYLGGALASDVRAWGPATMKQITSP